MATKHPKTDQDVVHYVCCKCGTDLTSKQALKTHEKTCQTDVHSNGVFAKESLKLCLDVHLFECTYIQRLSVIFRSLELRYNIHK